MIFDPSKLFPCDCMGEGITITPYTDTEDISENEVLMSEDKKMRDCKESPFIQFSFWQYGVSTKPRWNRWWRLKIAWYVFWAGTAWPDMVIMTSAHAKNFANHILYTISKAEKEMKQSSLEEELLSPDVKLEIDDAGLDLTQPHAMKLEADLLPNVDTLVEEPQPMLCVQHGGSAACEENNEKHGFDCPKCPEGKYMEI